MKQPQPTTLLLVLACHQLQKLSDQWPYDGNRKLRNLAHLALLRASLLGQCQSWSAVAALQGLRLHVQLLLSFGCFYSSSFSELLLQMLRARHFVCPCSHTSVSDEPDLKSQSGRSSPLCTLCRHRQSDRPCISASSVLLLQIRHAARCSLCSCRHWCF